MDRSFIASLPHGPVINPATAEGCVLQVQQGLTFANAAWPSANLAIYQPFMVYQTFPCARIGFRNNTASGNVDMGIYDANGVRLKSLGSTAISGSNIFQSAAFALDLPPGLYYMAMSYDGTGNIARYAGSTLQRGIIRGAYQEALGSVTLPATATFATQTSSYIPVMGISCRSGFF